MHASYPRGCLRNSNPVAVWMCGLLGKPSRFLRVGVSGRGTCVRTAFLPTAVLGVGDVWTGVWQGPGPARLPSGSAPRQPPCSPAWAPHLSSGLTVTVPGAEWAPCSSERPR